MPKTTQIIHWRVRRQQRRKRSGQTLLKIAGILALVLLIGLFLGVVGSVAVGTAVYATFTQDLPEYAQLVSRSQQPPAITESSKIYAAGDAPVLIYEIIDPLDGERPWLTLDQLPQSLIDATLAVEDASSITRRLIKNTLIEPAQPASEADAAFTDYQRSVKERLLAQRIASTYSQEQILEWYINTSFYGNLAYGAEAAARVYFDKPVSALTLPEAALLAAIPQAPAFNPIDYPDEVKARQERVLDGMVGADAITPEQAAAAKLAPLQIQSGEEERLDIIAPHFALEVRQQLEQMFCPELLLDGGLKVYTTLDLTMQQQAECVAQAQVARLSGVLGSGLPADVAASCGALAYLPPLNSADVGVDHQVDNAAVVMLDPRTAEIKALVGSLNYWDTSIDGSFNAAVAGLRQPGPAFKPFTYLTALSQGYTPATMMLDVETDFGAPDNGVPYVPQNDDGQFRGPLRLREALGSGYNVPAVQAMSWVGVDRVLRIAHNLGITTLDQGAGEYGLSLALGGGEVSLLDMVYAYSVMDNNGVMVGQPRPEAEQRPGYRSLDPVMILRVEDRDGAVLYEYDAPVQRDIITPQLAYLMNDMLSDRSARCGGFGCPNVLELPDNRPAAVKTGTTNDYRDAWTVGYTPQLVTGVWLGNSDNREMENVPGDKGAAPVWRALMAWALAEEPVELWQRPSGLVEMAVCNISGLLPTEFCPTVPELFIAGTQPTVYDNMYQEFAVNRETGRLATIYTPPELVENRVYQIYPETAAEWARENGVEAPPTEFDTITQPGSESRNARIILPPDFAVVDGEVEVFGTAAGDNFSFYRLAYFAGLTPDDLQTIVEAAEDPVTNNVLGVWDTSGLNGLYTILLTVVGEDGRFEETSVHVTIEN